jgi:hypothetical protein
LRILPEERSFFTTPLHASAILSCLITKRIESASYLQLIPAIFAIEVAPIAAKTPRLHHLTNVTTTHR